MKMETSVLPNGVVSARSRGSGSPSISAASIDLDCRQETESVLLPCGDEGGRRPDEGVTL